MLAMGILEIGISILKWLPLPLLSVFFSPSDLVHPADLNNHLSGILQWMDREKKKELCWQWEYCRLEYLY